MCVCLCMCVVCVMSATGAIMYNYVITLVKEKYMLQKMYNNNVCLHPEEYASVHS